MLKNLSITFLVLLLLSLASKAQNYPVQSTPLVAGGSNMQWSNFYTSTEKFKLQLILKDKDKPSLEVFLRLKIERAGLSIRTREDLFPPQITPIRLNFGQATQLTGPQLMPYFSPDNLTIEGLDPAFLRQGGSLPDGLYTVTVTAFEYDPARGHRQVSNSGVSLFSVYLGLPPIIQFPKDGHAFQEMGIQNFLFQWLPRTASSSGPGTQAYQLELFELAEGEEAQQVAEGSNAVFFSTVTTATSLPYGPGLPNFRPLKTGGRYAMRVQALSSDPSQSYQNNGYSQVVGFTYGQPCIAPPDLSMGLSNSMYDKLSWSPVAGAESYTVRYGLKGSGTWDSVQVFSNYFDHYNPLLKDQWVYEVEARCSQNRRSEASAIDRSSLKASPCDAPTEIVFVSQDNGSIKMSWAEVNGVKDYTVRYKNTSGSYEEQTTSQRSIIIPYSKNLKAEIRTNCYGTEKSGWVDATQYIPNVAQARQAGPQAFQKSAEAAATPTTPTLESILNPFGTLVNSDGLTTQDIENKFNEIKGLNNQITKPCGADKIDALGCDPVTVTPETGTEAFLPTAGKYMYLNGYEILITSPNEGLLYLPLIQSRVPVNWQGLQIKASKNGTYGCVTQGQAAMQGSQTGVISNDLHRQVLALLTQEPGSFSGTFGDALDKFISKITVMISSPESINEKDHLELSGYLGGSLEGTNQFVTNLENEYPSPRPEIIQKRIDAIKNIENELKQVNTKLKNCTKENCDVDLISSKAKAEALKVLIRQFKKEYDFVVEVLKRLKSSGLNDETQVDVHDLVSQAGFSGDQIDAAGGTNIYLKGVTVNEVSFRMELFSLDKSYKINIPVAYAEGGTSGAGVYANTGNHNSMNGFGVIGDVGNMSSLFEWLSLKKAYIMIFSNGYRSWTPTGGYFPEFSDSDNRVETSDTRNYWEGQDVPFRTRRNPTLVYYADGHHSITTSNHNRGGNVGASQGSFGIQLLASKDAQFNQISNCYHQNNAICVPMDTDGNDAGFMVRQANGRLAGNDLIDKLKSMFTKGLNVDFQIDIVAHSMGFAYAQGIIESLKGSELRGNIKWGAYYILAPENGCASSVNTGEWEQVWQYGSNESVAPRYEQDGVAPQCPVGGVPRAYIPEKYLNGTKIPIGYLESHQIKYYNWIFERQIGLPGYVTPR